MDYVYARSSDGELCHWGIKGMKWGVRRYQNSDGSLTPAGKKRYSSSKDGSDVATTPKKKSVSEMSDDELRSAIARKQLENQYLQYHPQPAKPESFAKRFVNDAVKPAAVNAGKNFVEQALKKVTSEVLKDKVDPNSLEGLEAANKKLRAKISNEWLKKGVDTTANWESATKQYNLQKEMKKDADAKTKAEADAKSYEDEMRKYRDYNDNWYENDNPSSSRDYTYGNSTYSNKGGETTYVNSSTPRGLTLYNSPVTELSTTSVSRGNKYVDSSSVMRDEYVVIVDQDGTETIVRRDDL